MISWGGCSDVIGTCEKNQVQIHAFFKRKYMKLRIFWRPHWLFKAVGRRVLAEIPLKNHYNGLVFAK